MATYFIAASRKQEGSSQLRDQRSPYSMRGMVDNKLVFSKKGLDVIVVIVVSEGRKRKHCSKVTIPGRSEYQSTVEGEPANVHFYSMSCEYELLLGTLALKPLRQCVQWQKVKFLFMSENSPWNSVISLCFGFEMYFIYWFHTDIFLLFSLSPTQNRGWDGLS